MAQGDARKSRRMLAQCGWTQRMGCSAHCSCSRSDCAWDRSLLLQDNGCRVISQAWRDEVLKLKTGARVLSRGRYVIFIRLRRLEPRANVVAEKRLAFQPGEIPCLRRKIRLDPRLLTAFGPARLRRAVSPKASDWKGSAGIATAPRSNGWRDTRAKR